MMKKARVFEFSRFEADLESGEFNFKYKIVFDNDAHEFAEKLNLPDNFPIKKIKKELLEAALQSLHLILGISYYKLYCPPELKINQFSLTKKQAEFWNTVYTKGLGEFFYKNKIDFRSLINFPYSVQAKVQSFPCLVSDKYLLGIGGGKDSIVAAEMLKEEKKEFSSFTLGRHPLQENIIDLIGSEKIIMERKIDPKLFELSKSGQGYNGHIPISAIYAFSGLLAAILYGFKYLVFANEKSANYGNVEYLGQEINHQWSKSEAFENLFAKYVQTFITPDVQYFSILRQLKNVETAKRFSKYKKYFSIFSSCNTNFKIIGTKPKKRWCGVCPKCAFAFCSLAPFISKQEMLKIFGKNLLNDPSLIYTYKQFLGKVDFKPFECVGTPEESLEVFRLLVKNKDYKEDLAVKVFKSIDKG